MIAEPPKIDHRRPRRSLMIPTNGKERMAPSEYAAAMMPFKDPENSLPGRSLKSADRRCQLNRFRDRPGTISRTGLPGRHDLQRIDQLRIESGGQLDAHASRKEHEVKMPKVWFLVPRHWVILSSFLDDGICSSSGRLLRSMYHLDLKEFLE